MTKEYYDSNDELVCPHCGRDWYKVHDNWMRAEKCLCGEFLDNPPQLIKKEEYKPKSQTTLR